MSQRGSGVAGLGLLNPLCAVLCAPQILSTLTNGQKCTGFFKGNNSSWALVAPLMLLLKVLTLRPIVMMMRNRKSPPARWLHPPDPPADRLPVPKARGRLPGRKAGEVLPSWSFSCYMIGCRWRNSRRARIMPKRVPFQTLSKGIAKICHGPFVADGATSAWHAMGNLSPVAPPQA